MRSKTNTNRFPKTEFLQRLSFALLLSFFVALAFTACGDSPTGPGGDGDDDGDGGNIALELTQSADTADVGSEVTLKAVLTGADGNPLSGKELSWAVESGGGSLSRTATTTDDQGRASVTWTLGSEAGEQTASVSYRDLSKQATVVAESVEPESVTVTISAGSVSFDALEATTNLKATVSDADGNTIKDANITWSSSSKSVATVSKKGVVTAKSNGTATITATYKEASDQVKVTVDQKVASVKIGSSAVTLTALDATKDLQATPKDANGHAVKDANIKWSSSSKNVATVSKKGVVTARANGSAEISAEAGGTSAQMTVTVDQKISSFKVSPAEKTLAINGDLQLKATAEDANGHEVKGVSITWSTSARGVVSVSKSGFVIAKTKGEATITAEATEPAGGTSFTDTAAITVSSLTSVPVGPGNG